MSIFGKVITKKQSGPDFMELGVLSPGQSNLEQESLANAKVSARQPSYIGHNSVNHL